LARESASLRAMNRTSMLLTLAFAIIAAPVVAGPPLAKRPLCQAPRTPARDVRRVESCRKPPVPPVVDPTPMFLASTAPATAPTWDFS
jgi:hypothetical protein